MPLVSDLLQASSQKGCLGHCVVGILRAIVVHKPASGRFSLPSECTRRYTNPVRGNVNSHAHSGKGRLWRQQRRSSMVGITAGTTARRTGRAVFTPNSPHVTSARAASAFSGLESTTPVDC